MILWLVRKIIHPWMASQQSKPVKKHDVTDYYSVTIRNLRLIIIQRTSPSAHFLLIFQFKSIWSYISWKDVTTEIQYWLSAARLCLPEEVVSCVVLRGSFHFQIVWQGVRSCETFRKRFCAYLQICYKNTTIAKKSKKNYKTTLSCGLHN